MGRKPGRPKIEIDPERLKNLPPFVLSKNSLSCHLGVCPETLNLRMEENPSLSVAIKAALADARARADHDSGADLWARAAAGDMTARIWFEKTRLGYSDRQTNIQEGGVEIRVRREDPTSEDDAK